MVGNVSRGRRALRHGRAEEAAQEVAVKNAPVLKYDAPPGASASVSGCADQGSGRIAAEFPVFRVRTVS
jgi:hypothetical protein